ncbi:hypothetical protein BJV77DRAFT_1065281 [Russula vinacea]|nr:hypothetical protein BJV77DRAFT_1065281 [Russula vinacea]
MPFSPFTHSSRFIRGRVIVIVTSSWDATRPRHPSRSPSCRPLVVPPALPLAALSSSLLLSLSPSLLLSLSSSCLLSLSPSHRSCRPTTLTLAIPPALVLGPPTLVSVWVSACLREREREWVGLPVGHKHDQEVRRDA